MREVTIRVLAHKGDSKGEIRYVIDVVYRDIPVVIPSAQQEAKHVESVAGKITLKKLIDSEANSNITDEGTWEQLRVKGVKCESEAATPDKKLYPFASSQPLLVKGSFKCTVSVCDRSTKAEVLEKKGRGMSLLGKITGTELGVLKVGINIAMVRSKTAVPRGIWGCRKI